MRRADLCVLLTLLASVPPHAVYAQPAGTLQVRVENVPDDKGTVRVALCAREEFLRDDCRLHALVPATHGESRVFIQAVPAGIYAVQAYQDRDGDGQLGRNFLGIPREPIGFSRDPALHFGPPSFAQCAISVSAEGGTLTLRLRTR